MLINLLRRGWFFDKDGGAGGTTPPPDNSAEADPEKKDPAKAGDDPEAKAEEKKFSQAELDAIVKDRLERAQKKAEKDAEKARQQAAEEALTKNQEWQTLAEQRQTRITELEKQLAELEGVKPMAEKYQTALNAQLKKATEKLPAYLKEVIEKMDPVEAMEYINRHAEELGAKPATYSETPDPKQKKVTKDEEREGQRANSAVIANNF